MKYSTVAQMIKVGQATNLTTTSIAMAHDLWSVHNTIQMEIDTHASTSMNYVIGISESHSVADLGFPKGGFHW